MEGEVRSFTRGISLRREVNLKPHSWYSVFRYVITTGLIIGKIHIHFAETRKGLPVVLKFYASRETYENAKMMHQHLKDLSCVCT